MRVGLVWYGIFVIAVFAILHGAYLYWHPWRFKRRAAYWWGICCAIGILWFIVLGRVDGMGIGVIIGTVGYLILYNLK